MSHMHQTQLLMQQSSNFGFSNNGGVCLSKLWFFSSTVLGLGWGWIRCMREYLWFEHRCPCELVGEKWVRWRGIFVGIMLKKGSFCVKLTTYILMAYDVADSLFISQLPQFVIIRSFSKICLFPIYKILL